MQTNVKFSHIGLEKSREIKRHLCCLFIVVGVPIALGIALTRWAVGAAILERGSTRVLLVVRSTATATTSTSASRPPSVICKVKIKAPQAFERAIKIARF